VNVASVNSRDIQTTQRCFHQYQPSDLLHLKIAITQVKQNQDAGMLLVKESELRPSDSPNFEQALAALEKIVHELEEGNLGLEEAVGRYEAGVKLLKQCHGLLAEAERRIELLTGVDASGQPIVEAFDEQQATSLEEKAKTRSKRRSTPERPAARPPSDMDEPGSLF
jgi:exodeoxyribonuclease VII small subunit